MSEDVKPVSPSWYSFYLSIVLSTVSNAFDKSMKRDIVMSLFAVALVIYSV